MHRLLIPAAMAAAVFLPMGAANAAPQNGFYVGVNAGYDLGDTATSTTVTAGSYFAGTSVTSINSSSPTDLDKNGFIGGGQLGFLFSHAGFAWGAEADFNWMGRSQSSAVTVVYPCCGPTSYTSGQSMERDWLATVRARLGVDVGGAMVYGTGGLAIGDVAFGVTFSDTFLPVPATTYMYDKTRTGWTAGGGLEVPLAAKTSAKLEYLYVDLGTVTASGTLPTGGGTLPVITGVAKFTNHVIRAGINIGF